MADILGLSQPGDVLGKVSELQNLQKALKTWQATQQAGIPVAPGLAKADLSRVQRGSSPYTTPEFGLANLAVAKGGSVVPEPHHGFFGSIAGDIGGMWKTVMHPGVILDDLKKLPELPGLIEGALSQGGGLSATVHRLSQLPVLRMLPGDFLAQSLTDPRGIKQGLADLADHPVYTFMDLMPIAEGGVKALGLKTAEGAAIDSVRAAAGHAYKTLEGKVLQARPGWEGHTPGAVLDRLGVGPTIRTMMEKVMPGDRELRQAVDTVQRRVEQLYTDHGITKERGAQLTDLMEHGAPNVAKRQNWFETLHPNEQAFVTEVAHELDQWTHRGLDEKELFLHKGEVWSKQAHPALWEHLDAARAATERAGEREASRAFKPWHRISHPYASTTEMIPVEQLKPFREFDRAAKTYKGSEHIDELATSMKKNGTREPLVLSYDARAGRALLEEGNHRLAAAEKAGIKELPVRVYGQARVEGGVQLDHPDLPKENEHGYIRADMKPSDIIAKAEQPLRGPGKAPEYWHAKAEAARAAADAYSAKENPGRFSVLVGENTRAALSSIVTKGGGTAEDWAHVVEWMGGGRWHEGIRGLDEATAKTIVAENKASWEALRSQGFDPAFVHHVGEAGKAEMAYPRLVPERIPTMTQLRKRSLVMDTWSKDITVSLSHQAFEYLRSDLTEKAVASLHEAGVFHTAASVDALIKDQATRELAAEMKGAQPTGEQLAGQMQAIRARDWRRVDFEKALPFRKPWVVRNEAETWVKKPVATAFEKMRDGPGAISKATRKPMQAFRVSVLALSPSYYLHVALGNAIAIIGQTSPAVISRWFHTAYEMYHNHTIPPEVAQGLIEVPEEVRAWQVEAGGFLAKINNSLRNVPGFRGNVWGPAEAISDISRTIAYLEGKSKGGHAAGMMMVKKIFQNWDSMTPIERTMVRSVIPFYGFARYVLRYTSAYPFDHPLRASILSNLSRAELADSRSKDLPDQLRNLIFLGHPDARGNVKGINAAGLDPFYDVGSFFTLAGWKKRLNPLFDPALEAMGISQSGAPDLHPNVTYDPATGQLVAKGPSPLSLLGGLATGLFPQAGGIADIIGQVTGLRASAGKDPEAFKRQVLNAFGVRSFPTSYNIQQIMGKTEIAKYQAIMQALAGAKKGQLAQLEQYPGFQNLVSMLQRVNAGA